MIFKDIKGNIIREGCVVMRMNSTHNEMQIGTKDIVKRIHGEGGGVDLVRFGKGHDPCNLIVVSKYKGI